MCVWQYKLFGDKPECFNFVAASCGERYSGNSAYTMVGSGMTAGEADARIGQLSSYFDDAYGCHGAPKPPPPPAVVVTGSTPGGTCVYRYKLFGDPPACFHFLATACGTRSPPNYEAVGANMNGSEAERRIAELSYYFSNAYVCAPAPTPPDDKSKTDPNATTTADPTTPDPPAASPAPPDPPAPPTGPFISRFGFAEHAITIKVGETASPRVYATYSNAPDTVVDVTGQVSWSGNRPPFTAKPGDVGTSFTASLGGFSDSASVTVVDTPKPPEPPKPPTRPSILSNTTTTTETKTVEKASGGPQLGGTPATGGGSTASGSGTERPLQPGVTGSRCNYGEVTSWSNALERGGHSTWRIKRDGTAEESGMGGSSGVAAMSDTSVVINWRSPDDVQRGTYNIVLNQACSGGEGTVTWTKWGDPSLGLKLPPPQKATFTRTGFR